MISDSIPNASLALPSSNPRDFAKKKRANRSAKLKQCKLDARREQWLSRVNENKVGCKEELNGEKSGACGGLRGLGNKRNLTMEIKRKVEEEIYINGLSIHDFSDSESSPSNSPTSRSSRVSKSNDTGSNFTPSSRSGSSSGRSCSCSTNGCFSGSMSDEDEGDIGDDGCLDDWEVMADALAATKDNRQEHIPKSGIGLSMEKHGNSGHCGSQMNQPSCKSDVSDVKQESGGTHVQLSPINRQAWRPDDAFRPQSLPNLSKHYSFPLNSERHFGSGGPVWGCKNFVAVAKSCPICYEDFDCTDSSFTPCVCEFRLCLFCHKRILEEDGRCPGCRKPYNSDPLEGEATFDGGSLKFRLARSCSMIARS